VVLGTVSDAGPKLTYTLGGKPECKLTLIVEEAAKGGEAFRLYLPVFLYGDQAESAAESLDAGDVVCVDGKLSWKSTLKKDGTKLGLCVSTFAVELISKAGPAGGGVCQPAAGRSGAVVPLAVERVR
jgi:single-stranded DNA-binding protein